MIAVSTSSEGLFQVMQQSRVTEEAHQTENCPQQTEQRARQWHHEDADDRENHDDDECNPKVECPLCPRAYAATPFKVFDKCYKRFDDRELSRFGRAQGFCQVGCWTNLLSGVRRR